MQQHPVIKGRMWRLSHSAKYGGTRRLDTTMDHAVANLNYRRLEARPYTDNAGFSYRLDGNNVDPDTEGVYLAENQLRYQGLIQSINDEFSNLKMVMK